jgi:hypothetical protein
MENGPFIDGLPSYKMVIFHGYVSHDQMVVISVGLTNLHPKSSIEFTALRVKSCGLLAEKLVVFGQTRR